MKCFHQSSWNIFCCLSHLNNLMQRNTMCLQTLWSSSSRWRQLFYPRTFSPEHMPVMFSHTQMRACKTSSLSLSLSSYPLFPSYAPSVVIPWALSLHNSGLTHCSGGLIHPSHLMDEQKSSLTLLPHFLWLYQSVAVVPITHIVYNSGLCPFLISGLRLSFMGVRSLALLR